jgi:toxin ParE1/3/4
MLDIRLRSEARRDLKDVWRYTKQRWSVDQADTYLAKLNADIERLRKKPALGRPVKDAQAPFFKRASGSHVIFFLVHANTLDIVRILHERMDFTAHLANDDM